MNANVLRYMNGGHDVMNAEEMTRALEAYGGVPGSIEYDG